MVASLAALILLATAMHPAAEQTKAKAPTFKVDPTWPQEMPNHWIMCGPFCSVPAVPTMTLVVPLAIKS